MSPKPKRTNILVNGKIVGYVRGNTFYKTISGSKHFLQKPRAIAFDTSSLIDAKTAGADRVYVTDRETSRVYASLISNIRTNGEPFNRKHGDQYWLEFRFWSKPGDEDTKQLSLFEE
jgi:hypothetical protein